MKEAWVSLESEEAARARGRRSVYDFGRLPNMARLIDAHPAIAPHFGALYREIMFGDGMLSRAEREMVAAVAAAAQDCVY